MPPTPSPRILLATAVALLALVALPSTSTAAATAARAGCAGAHVAPSAANLPVVRAAVLCLHNRARSAHGLPRLAAHAKLRSAAARHSADMVRAGYFAHTARGGADLADRILGTGYGRRASWSLGENIAYGRRGQASAAAIHRTWMTSPAHRANILRREFREVGIGIALGAPVGRRAHGATYTADFGVRR